MAGTAYATHVKPIIDDDAVEEYWLEIRGLTVPAEHLCRAAMSDDERR